MEKGNNETVKGFKDYTGTEAKKIENIKKIIAETFERYGFEPSLTPIIEHEEFMKKGNEQDEAVSDIFRLKDKGGRDLALRYEFTFQLKRLARNKKTPYKRYQIGHVFRDEPISKNRFRQFTQCDADIVGSSVKEEAELIVMTSEIFKKLGLSPIILANSRKLMNQILRKEKIKNKEQVLREIDKYGKIPESEVIKNLEKYGAGKLISDFKKGSKFFSQFSAYKEVQKLIDICKDYGVKVLFSPTVVRGLSYYDGNVFEIRVKGIKESMGGGGSYKVGDANSTGISFGVERLASISTFKKPEEKMLVISLNEDKEAIRIAQALRKNGKNVSLFYGKPSKALQYANSYGFARAVFVGKQEVKNREFKVKNLKTGAQSKLEL